VLVEGSGSPAVALEDERVVAHDHPLVQRLVNGHREPASHLGLAEEKQAQTVLGVHLLVGEQPQVFEHVAAQVLGPVDHEDRAAASLGDEPGDLAGDLAEEGSTAALDAQSHLQGDGLVQVEHAVERPDVDDTLDRGVELGEHAACAARRAAAAAT